MFWLELPLTYNVYIYIYIFVSFIQLLFSIADKSFGFFLSCLSFAIKVDTCLDQQYFSYLKPIQLFREIAQNICD